MDHCRHGTMPPIAAAAVTRFLGNAGSPFS
jgi:hypothetical protein